MVNILEWFRTQPLMKDWKELIRYTRYNDSPIRELGVLKLPVETPFGRYVNGQHVVRTSGKIVLTTYTVLDKEQIVNSVAEFKLTGEFISGKVNGFTFGWMKDDGSYFTEMFEEEVENNRNFDVMRV